MDRMKIVNKEKEVGTKQRNLMVVIVTLRVCIPLHTMDANKIETFINDRLREDLKVYEKHLNEINAEIMEYNQLRHTADTIKNHLSDGFKTKVDIGGNFFAQAKVEETDKILVNVGLNYFVEFQLDEAIKFCDFKVRVLNKEADIVREESLKTRANIKLALMCLGDKNKMNFA